MSDRDCLIGWWDNAYGTLKCGQYLANTNSRHFCPVCEPKLIQVRGDDYEKLIAENEELKKRNESLLRDLDILVNVTPKEYRDMAREIREEGGEV